MPQVVRERLVCVDALGFESQVLEEILVSVKVAASHEACGVFALCTL